MRNSGALLRTVKELAGWAESYKSPYDFKMSVKMKLTFLQGIRSKEH